MAWSNSVAVLDYNCVGGFLVVDCSDGRQRRFKISLSSSVDHQMLNDIGYCHRNQVKVKFRAFGNWSPDAWFCEVDIQDKEDAVTFINVSKIARAAHVDMIREAVKFGFRRMKFATIKPDVGMSVRIQDEFQVVGGVRAVGSHWFNRADDHHVIVVNVANVVDNPAGVVHTVFHEMRHAHQHMAGVKHDQFWKGVDFTGTPYEDQPWEHDANKAATIMVKEFTKQWTGKK